MLVRDLGNQFQIVLQPDHGDVSGQLAESWKQVAGLSPEVHQALRLAAARHDDGWAVWERRPRLDEQGRPQIFSAVPVDSLLTSYRACVDVLCADSPAAGLLVSMHVSGLQRNRYGATEAGGRPTPLDEIKPAIREFVRGEEERQADLVQRLGLAEEQRWQAYRLLQVYDTFSLYLGLADLGRGDRQTIDIGIDGIERANSETAPLKLVAGDSAWTVHCDPFPFAANPVVVRMSRRIVGKRRWADERSFREDFARATVEEVHIRLQSSGPEARGSESDVHQINHSARA